MNTLARFLATALFVYISRQAYLVLYLPPPIPAIQEDAYWGPGEPQPDDQKLHKFRINVSDAVLDDLKTRLSLELRLQPPLQGVNFEYGFNTDALRNIVKFWREEYDWRTRETELNQFPQFVMQVNGLKVHFIHAKAKNLPANIKVLPLLLVHGWPGSVKEFQKIIPMLIHPIEGLDFVFEVIAPSLPGYTFSEASHKPGLNPANMAVIFRQLMLRLGRDKFYVQGGDWGSVIVSNLAVLYPDNVLGLHANMCRATSPAAILYMFISSFWPSMFVDSDMERQMYPLSNYLSNAVLESGYLHIQATKPDTVGMGLNNSPAGLAAYILEKFSTATNLENRGRSDGGLTEKFTLPDLLDNVMLYWLSGSMTSAMRIYAETFNKQYLSEKWEDLQVKVPAFCAQFPNEVLKSPYFTLHLKYPNLVPRTLPAKDDPLYEAVRPPRGGHFAAMEEPQLLANSIFQAVKLFREKPTRTYGS